MSTQPVDDIRKNIRNSILSSKAERRELTFFGQAVEIAQPSLSEILDVQSSENPGQSMAEMIIRYMYVPGSNVRVFDQADTDAILRLPFGPDMQHLQDIISELTGVEAEVEQQTKN